MPSNPELVKSVLTMHNLKHRELATLLDVKTGTVNGWMVGRMMAEKHVVTLEAMLTAEGELGRLLRNQLAEARGTAISNAARHDVTKDYSRKLTALGIAKTLADLEGRVV